MKMKRRQERKEWKNESCGHMGLSFSLTLPFFFLLFSPSPF